MENPGYEDEDKVTRVVDYSSSSEDDDDDENLEPSFMKHLSDSESDTLSHNDESPAPLLKKQRLNDSVPDGNGSPNLDSKEKVYCVSLGSKAVREESKCLELLDEIGCRERYLGCSIEQSGVFFANLKKDEAARLEGMDEVYEILARRHTVSDL
ncbi:hypothetical protein vseg_008163 [Gypsophila vaccaria]